MSRSGLLDRALAGLRQGGERAAAELTRGFAAAVAAVPAERLQQLMATPAGRLVVEAIFWQMPRQLDRQRAQTVNASARWRITTEASPPLIYDLHVVSGRASVSRGGGHEEPPLTITADRVAFVRIASGNADPMGAYFKREVAIAGDIMVAAKLVSLFRIPA